MIGLVFCLRAAAQPATFGWPFGWHASFDFRRNFFYIQCQTAAIVFQGHLSNATLHGPDWKTGGNRRPGSQRLQFLGHGNSGRRDSLSLPQRRNQSPTQKLRKLRRLVDELRGLHQAHALRLPPSAGLHGEPGSVAECGCPMAHGFSFFTGAANRQFELFAHPPRLRRCRRGNGTLRKAETNSKVLRCFRKPLS